jgi:UDP-glucose 4-epimerase
MMRILVLAGHPPGTVPGQRFRFEQYEQRLRGHGIDLDASGFLTASVMPVLHRPGATARKVHAVVAGMLRRVRDLRAAGRYDAALVFREATPIGYPWVERLLPVLGLPFAFDFDDAIYLTNASEANSAIARLKFARKTAIIARHARLVTVGNEDLAGWAAQHAREVRVIPTTIDLSLYHRRDARRDPHRPVCVGWSGSITTAPYLRQIAPVLRELQARHRIRIRVVGDPNFKIPGAEVEALPWREATEVVDLSEIDIGVMPLPDDEWARGKCGLKALQYMALGIPTVMSPVGVNCHIAQGGSARLAQTPEQWTATLTALIGDPGLREALGAAGRARVEREYSADGLRRSGPTPCGAWPSPGAATVAEPRVLVTGAAGFIGSHVADECLALGMDVVATDDLSGGHRENVPDGAHWIEGDLRDGEFVRSLWQHGPYAFVYHLGAYAAEGLSHFIRAYNYRTNLEASVNLINASVLGNVKRFVFTSSIAVYGPGQVPMREDTVPIPEDPYGISKYAVELDLAAARRLFGLDYTVFRPHNVYGERQNIADRYRNVIGIFMNSLMQGLPMPVFGDGLQTRSFSHISDVAPVIARAPLVPEAANEVFNIGADRPHTILELAEALAAEFGVPVEVTHLPARDEVVHAFSDHAKLRRVFGESAALGLREGIARMASWVRTRGPQAPMDFPGEIEVPRNLPPSWRDSLRASAGR